jgi:hypothetical protein
MDIGKRPFRDASSYIQHGAVSERLVLYSFSSIFSVFQFQTVYIDNPPLREKSCGCNCANLQSEAEFLDVIGTKILRMLQHNLNVT